MSVVAAGTSGAAGVHVPELLGTLARQMLDQMLTMQRGVGLGIGVGLGLLLVGGMLWRRRQIQTMLGPMTPVGTGRWRGVDAPKPGEPATHGTASHRRLAPWIRHGGQQPRPPVKRTLRAIWWLMLQGRVGGIIRRSPASWGTHDRPRGGRMQRTAAGGPGMTTKAGGSRRSRPVRPHRSRRKPQHRQQRGWQIEFRAAGERSLRTHPASIEHIVGVVTAAIGTETGQPDRTAVVAVEEKGGMGTTRLAPHVLLTPGQQRRVQARIAAAGYGGRWKDDRTIFLRMPRTTGAYGATGMLWLPVMEQRGTTVWWPIHLVQHLVLAGESGGLLEAALFTLTNGDRVNPPRIMVFDPQQQGRDITGALAPYLGDENGLAVARIQQLRDGFRRKHGATDRAETILIVIMPREDDWRDLDPLLHDTGTLHILLVVGSQAPIPQLRGVCHRTAVVEAPSVIYPGLPDAFRPATLATGREGQALAWQPGESFLWRGTVLPQTESQTSGADDVPDMDDQAGDVRQDDDPCAWTATEARTCEKGSDRCQDT